LAIALYTAESDFVKPLAAVYTNHRAGNVQMNAVVTIYFKVTENA